MITTIGTLVTMALVLASPYIAHAILRCRRRRPPKSFLDDAARWRASQFKRNKKKCENYSPDNSKYGVSCIFPWCDYCSFFCERKEARRGKA